MWHIFSLESHSLLGQLLMAECILLCQRIYMCAQARNLTFQFHPVFKPGLVLVINMLMVIILYNRYMPELSHDRTLISFVYFPLN